MGYSVNSFRVSVPCVAIAIALSRSIIGVVWIVNPVSSVIGYHEGLFFEVLFIVLVQFLLGSRLIFLQVNIFIMLKL